KSIRYKGWIAKLALALFAVSFVVLAYCGMKPPSGIFPLLARIFTTVYFAFFLLMPWWSRLGSFKPVPDRVSSHHAR
ncbi:MAG TPA: cytochrome b, partial [Steroidobacteraceae bacterium]|nr:cytochrome b [Steroidobacteraceae bacterium]